MILRKFAQLCLDCDVIFGNAFHQHMACPRCGSAAFTPISQYIKESNAESMAERLHRIKKERENETHSHTTSDQHYHGADGSS